MKPGDLIRASGLRIWCNPFPESFGKDWGGIYTLKDNDVGLIIKTEHFYIPIFYDSDRNCDFAFIIVANKVGWVNMRYLEKLDETR